MRLNGQTAFSAFARVTIEKPTIRKIDTYQRLRHRKRISLAKPINSALVDVSRASARYSSARLGRSDEYPWSLRLLRLKRSRRCNYLGKSSPRNSI